MATRNQLNLDPAQLLEIEKRLWEYPFMGTPMGAVLNDFFVIKFWHANGRFSFWRSVCDAGLMILSFGAMGFRSFRNRKAYSEACLSQKNKIIFTSISEKDHFIKLIQPLAKCIGPSRVIIVGAGEHVHRFLPRDAQFINKNQIPTANPSIWFGDFLKVSRQWVHTIRDEFRKNRCKKGAYALPAIINILMIACERYVSYRNFLKKLKPIGILTEYDRNNFTVPLILAAKSLGIPTATMQHGVINGPYGYTPLVSDTIFTWGKRSSDALREYSLSKEKIVITGCPSVTIEKDVDQQQALRSLGLYVEKPVVLLATNPLAEKARHELAEMFCRAFVNNGEVSALVRLHPSESLQFYKKEIKRYPQVRFLESKQWTKTQSLCCASIVVCQSSGFGIEALLYSKPVVMVQLQNGHVMAAESMAMHAGCPVTENSEQLSSTVMKLLEDKRLYSEQVDKAVSYLKSSYNAIGAEAVCHTVDELNNKFFSI